MLDYDATLTVERPASQDGLGRSSGSASTVYDGRADVQERSVTRRTSDGQAFRIGDAQAFLPPGTSVHTIQQGDTATITWAEGDTQDATVAETVRLDDKIVLSYD